MSAPAFCASDVEKLDGRINESRTVIQEIMATPDKAIPDSITKKAVCIGEIPGVKKGGFSQSFLRTFPHPRWTVNKMDSLYLSALNQAARVRAMPTLITQMTRKGVG